MKDNLQPLLVTILLISFMVVTASAYVMRDSSLSDNYQDPNNYENLARYLMSNRNATSVYRRSCIRRGSSCDQRPNDCCFSSSCRCNLWGTNCRCQRVGLFQKWGK